MNRLWPVVCSAAVGAPDLASGSLIVSTQDACEVLPCADPGRSSLCSGNLHSTALTSPGSESRLSRWEPQLCCKLLSEPRLPFLSVEQERSDLAQCPPYSTALSVVRLSELLHVECLGQFLACYKLQHILALTALQTGTAYFTTLPLDLKLLKDHLPRV